MTRTCARGTGTNPPAPARGRRRRCRCRRRPTSTRAGAGGEEPGGGDVGAELGQGPGLVRALEGAGGGGGPVPDPGGGVGREIGGEQAMPSRSGVYSTRRSAALVAWRASMPAGWWRSRQVRALARNRDGTAPRPGSRGPGSVLRGPGSAFQPGRPGRIQAAGFVHDDPGVGPGDRPGLKGGQGQRQRRRQGLGFGEEGRGGAFADGQDTGDLGHQGDLLDGAVPRGRRAGGARAWLPARSRRPAAPSTPRSGPPAGRPRPARPDRHPPAAAADRRLPTGRQQAHRRVSPGAAPAKAASAATEAATASTAAPLSALNSALHAVPRSIRQANHEPPTILMRPKRARTKPARL